MTQDVFGIVGSTQGGSFRVERAVAEGGFSVIYRAQHGAFRAPVALKCLKVPGDLTAPERASYLEKFREEAEILFRLSATIAEVVRPLHVDQLNLDDGRFAPFLALEWLEGEALDEIIDHRRRSGQAPMGLFKVVKLLAPVARGLARGHRFPGPGGTISIVHRDIKPQNIFVATVAGAEKVKILDFGIATAIMAAERGAGLRPLAETDPVRAFTPRYASPEQWEPERFGAVGPWTDVWGLAMTMVEALIGRPALAGTQDEMRRKVFDVAARPTPRTLGATISDEAEAAFTRALAVDPKRRTRTVEGFWTELEAALRLPPSLSRRDDRRDTGRVSLTGPTLTGRPLPREDFDEPPPAASSHRSAVLEVPDEARSRGFEAAPARISEVGPEPRSSRATGVPVSSGGEAPARRDDAQPIAFAATMRDPRRRSAPPPSCDGAEVLASAPEARELELAGSPLAAPPSPPPGEVAAAADSLALDLPPAMPADLDAIPLEAAPAAPVAGLPAVVPDSPIAIATSPDLELPPAPAAAPEPPVPREAAEPARQSFPAVEPAASTAEPSTAVPSAPVPSTAVSSAPVPSVSSDPRPPTSGHVAAETPSSKILPLELNLRHAPTPDAGAAKPPMATRSEGAAATRASDPSLSARTVPMVPSRPQRQSLMALLRLPLQLIGAGLLLVILDLVLGLRLADMRPIMYTGALLVVAGTAVFFWRFLSE